MKYFPAAFALPFEIMILRLLTCGLLVMLCTGILIHLPQRLSVAEPSPLIAVEPETTSVGNSQHDLNQFRPITELFPRADKRQAVATGNNRNYVATDHASDSNGNDTL